jgi:hypothetical protein
MRFNFHLGARRPTAKQWAAYSVAVAIAVPLAVHYGNALLRSRHGAFARDAICAASRVLTHAELARMLSTLCRAAKDGEITPDEARTAIGRAQQATGLFREYFDNDRDNTDLRARDEVDFAVEQWERANPSPRIDPALRGQFPSFTEEQLCVLSQAERYAGGNSIGIRYVGMSVCEDEGKITEISVPNPR